MKMTRLFWIGALLLFCFIAFDAAAQCPMCKTSLEEARKNGTEVGSSLNAGILYLLALPYSIATIFGFVWWRKSKSKKNTAA